MKIKTTGTLYIIASPSGGGKTSLVNQLLIKDNGLRLSISHTTRVPRPGEQDGKEYYFVKPDEFQDLVNRGEFLEHATVFNHCYGTSKQQLVAQLQQGFDVILDIDWQGARQLVDQFDNLVSIFILPPSYEVLEQRLRARNQDDDDTIKSRMSQAQQEIAHCPEFDYVLFNVDFEHCVAELQAIIAVQRLKYSQQCLRNAELLSKLLKSG